MKKFRILLFLLAVISLGIYSCEDDDDDSDSDLVTQQDRDFARNAAFANIAEIELGELALQRGEHDSVLAFARMMIADHNVSRRQLDSIADRLNIDLPDDMDPAHETMRITLAGLNNAAFDSAYMHNQVLDHQASRTLHQSEIDMGNNKDLVDFARRKLPGIVSHLERATRIRDSLNNQ